MESAVKDLVHLKAKMADERYWNRAHRDHERFVAEVTKGFEGLFGTGPVKRDITGRQLEVEEIFKNPSEKGISLLEGGPFVQVASNKDSKPAGLFSDPDNKRLLQKALIRVADRERSLQQVASSGTSGQGQSGTPGGPAPKKNGRSGQPGTQDGPAPQKPDESEPKRGQPGTQGGEKPEKPDGSNNILLKILEKLLLRFMRRYPLYIPEEQYRHIPKGENEA